MLLKNEGGILPLDPARMNSIALIGPNAKTPQIMGGGSAQVNAHYAVSPYDAIVEAVGESVEMAYEIGCTNHKMMPRMDQRQLRVGTENGFGLEYFNGNEIHGEPVHRATGGSEQVWLGEIAPGVGPGVFSLRMTGTFTAAEDGDHAFGSGQRGFIAPVRGRCRGH